MNASDLTKKWIKINRIENPKWSLIGGIIKNLMRRMSTNEIEEAMEIYLRHYKNGDIIGFSGNIKNIKKYIQNKKRV